MGIALGKLTANMLGNADRRQREFLICPFGFDLEGARRRQLVREIALRRL